VQDVSGTLVTPPEQPDGEVATLTQDFVPFDLHSPQELQEALVQIGTEILQEADVAPSPKPGQVQVFPLTGTLK